MNGISFETEMDIQEVKEFPRDIFGNSAPSPNMNKVWKQINKNKKSIRRLGLLSCVLMLTVYIQGRRIQKLEEQSVE